MMRGYRIIFFAVEDEECAAFPMSPAEIIQRKCSLNILDYHGDRDCVKPELKTIYFSDYKDEIGLQAAVVSELFSPEHKDKIIYSVHPSSTLLTLLRWYLLRNGAPNSTIETCLLNFQRTCVDICENFYKPTILSLERRSQFNCGEIRRWLGLPYDPLISTNLNCASAIDYLCLRL